MGHRARTHSSRAGAASQGGRALCGVCGRSATGTVRRVRCGGCGAASARVWCPRVWWGCVGLVPCVVRCGSASKGVGGGEVGPVRGGALRRRSRERHSVRRASRGRPDGVTRQTCSTKPKPSLYLLLLQTHRVDPALLPHAAIVAMLKHILAFECQCGE